MWVFYVWCLAYDNLGDVGVMSLFHRRKGSSLLVEVLDSVE